jgi:diguanylate cyclase (GGDEF)-like protein
MSDTLARLGGDEFAILMERFENRSNAERQVVEMLLKATLPMDVGGTAIPISASFGVAVYPADGTCDIELLRAADDAMYRRKRAKRRC